MNWYNENASNDFIDATQESTALTNTSTINVPTLTEEEEENTEPNTGFNTTINDLINLKLDGNGKFQVYINNENDDGEIRFYIKNAKNVNDFNFNILTQSYSNPRLTYNTKIDKDGKINYYHTFNIFNPVKLSGWYVINDDISALEITQNLIGVGIGALQGQVGFLVTDLKLLNLDYYAYKLQSTIEIAELFNLTHGLYTSSGRGALASWQRSPLTKKAFDDLFKSLDGVVDATTGMASMALPVLMSLKGSRLGLFTLYLNRLQNALTFAGITAGLYAIYSFLDDQQKTNIIDDIQIIERLKIDTRRNIDNGDTASLQPNNIYIDFLIIDQTTNNGFTKASAYESIDIQKGASLSIEIKDNGSGVLIAKILSTLKVGSGFNINEEIFIDKDKISGTTGQLRIVVTDLKSYQYILEQDGVKASTELLEVDSRQRRRQFIPNKNDFSEEFNIVETPSTNPITGEILKNIEIRLNDTVMLNSSNYTDYAFNLLAGITNELLEHTSNYVISTSNILETNIDTKIAITSNLLATNTNLYDTNTSNYIETTSNLLATNANIFISGDTINQNKLNILENIILPTGKTLLDNAEKTMFLGYKDRVSLNYNAIADAFIIPLKQVNKVVDDNNGVSALNYLINRPFLYVVANILQVDDNYSMVRGIVAYLLDNNNTTFSFSKKLSITNGVNVLYNLYDIGDNSLSYTRTANNLNLTFKQQTIRDFTTTNIYLNNPSLPESYTKSTVFGIRIGEWNIPANIFSNWNDDPRNYVVTDVDSANPKMNISNGKFSHFFFDADGGFVRYIKDFRFLLRMPYNLDDYTNDANPNDLWYYSVDVTYFGEDGVRTNANYNRVFNGAGAADVFIVSINKRIKDITFKYTVNEGQPKWASDSCFAIVEYMFITEEVITRQNEIVEYNMALPPYTEDAQITTEQVGNEIKIFYNNTNYIFNIPLNTANNRVRTTNTQENGQVILKIGDGNSRWYNMVFRLNAIWSANQKIALIDGYQNTADVKINSLEVNSIILNGSIANLSFSQIQGGIIQDAGSGRRRNVIDNIGTFVYTNEIVPSTTLISGNEYMLEWDEINNNYKNVLKPDLKGDKGDTGNTGNTGATGGTGSQGNIGNTGAVGATGLKGDKGDIGNTGAIGATGSQGNIGNTGAVGATGAQGDKGDIGNTGAIGATGSQGNIGNTGAVGATGSQGNIGNTGAVGATGAQGDKGDIGNTGAVGATGAQGNIGNTGNTGAVGATGSQGNIGNTGAVGNDGNDGEDAKNITSINVDDNNNLKLFFDDSSILTTTNNLIIDYTTLTNKPTLASLGFQQKNVYRIYPSRLGSLNNFRKIDGRTPDTYTVNEGDYADGVYTILYTSKLGSTDDFSAHNLFNKQTETDMSSQSPARFSSFNLNGYWNAGIQERGSYRRSQVLQSGGLAGEYLVINMPVSILLTKINIVTAMYNSTVSYIDHAPRLYAIYGRNNNSGNWSKILEETLVAGDYNKPYEYEFLGETLSQPNKMYQKIITNPLTGNATFNNFGIVVNKIMDEETLILGKIELFEDYFENQNIPTKIADFENIEIDINNALNASQFFIGDGNKITINDTPYLNTNIDLSPYRLISDTYTITQQNTQNNDTSNYVLNTSNYAVDTSNLTNVRINNLVLNDVSDAILNTKLEARAGTNITIDSSGIISSSGGGSSGGITYDDANRLDYEFLSEPVAGEDITTNYADPIVLLQPPVVSPLIQPIDIDGDYRYISFPYTTGANNTSYSITFNENTDCDILIVGAGGGGGHDRGGGGGSGSCLVYKNYVMNGNYTVNVGKGGLNVNGNDGLNGNDCSISNSGGDIFLAKGGGGGGQLIAVGKNGGCGGGAGSQGNFQGGTTVNTNKILGVNTAPSFNNNYIIYGSIGGRNTTPWNGGNLGAMDGAGGGGIGQGGTTSGSLNAVDTQFNPNNPGKGGDGRYFATINGINYNFKDYFGIVGVQDGSSGNFFIGGGGGGGDNSTGTSGTGGKGGGGLGGNDNTGGNAISNTGSGGGGAGGGNNLAGVGSNGIVIIRYKFNVPSVIVGTVITGTNFEYLTFLNTGSNETKYTITIPDNGTDIDLLLLDSSTFINTTILNYASGTYNLIVGKNGAKTSFGSTTTASAQYFSGVQTNITGTNVNYNSPIAILRYTIAKTETIQYEVDGLLKYTKDNGWLIDTAITNTIVSNTSLISILQSQMIQVFASLNAKSINAVYEWSSDNEWKIVEEDSNILMPQGNFKIRLRTINIFANNAVLPFYITVRDTTRSDGVVANTFTTYNSSDVIIYQRQQNTAKQHDLRIRIDDNEGFTSPFFNVTVSNLQWIIDNRS